MELQRDLGDFVSSIESAIDGWDESLGFFAEGRELVTFFPLPTITFFLFLSFQGSGGLGGSTGSSSVRNGFSRSSRRQGGRARVLSEDTFSESEAYGRFQRNAEDAGDDESYDDENDEGDDDDDGDTGHEEALDENDCL